MLDLIIDKLITIAIILICLLIAFLIIYLLAKLFWLIKLTPFPINKVEIDVSGQRCNKNKYLDLFEEYICSNYQDFYNYEASTRVKENTWYNNEINRINSAKLISFRKKHYLKKIDKIYKKCRNTGITVVFLRIRTSYHQRNNVKYAEKITSIEESQFMTFDTFRNLYNKLYSLGFETTLQKYNTRNQRSLMTKKLRDEIAKRDNYTCQMCGKYMPDGVGLQIDHIIPVSKGGKTVPSNLQVLCSKCNAKKSNKYY